MKKMNASLHELHMRLCLKLAEIARQRGEVPVGSVVVRDGAVIAEGVEGVRAQYDIAHHAEMEAIRRSCDILQTLDLSGCALYTNAEPCFMCSYAIRACRIGTVIFGAPVDTVGGFSSHFPVLSTKAVPNWGPPPEIVGAYCARSVKRQKMCYSPDQSFQLRRGGLVVVAGSVAEWPVTLARLTAGLLRYAIVFTAANRFHRIKQQCSCPRTDRHVAEY